MIRKLSALTMILCCMTACAAQRKPSAEPSMAPAPPPGAESAPATATPSSAAPTGGAAVEEPTTAPPPPPVSAPEATSGPATKTPSTAPKAGATKPTAPGVDSGGAGGGKPNSIGAAQSSFDDARKTFIAAADCIHMCKALTSMSNATTHLCELTQGGSEQKRCTDAKAKLAAADAKVKSTCGGCSD